MANLNTQILGALPLPVPPLAMQEEIAGVIATVDGKIAVEENRKQTLEVLFKTLLHNLMTAKVRVKDLDLSLMEEIV